MSGPTLQTRQCVTIPSRSLMVLNAKATIDKHMEGGLYKVVPNFLLSNEYPELVLIPTVHNVEITETQCIPYILLNLSEEEIFLRKGEILRHLEKEDITIEEITTETMFQNEMVELTKSNYKVLSGKMFITSPADVDTHRKVKLQDAEVLDKYKKEFEEMCEEYNDIFSKDSSDTGKTPLITMEIKTGDSPPVCQRPYNLLLKHIDWVQKELDTLEKAGVITRSVSPWASPIVIVPKRTAPGEPPKKRLCVDYRVINSLLPKANKAHSKAKGVLTLVPLPKIDEIYARLKGSKVYSGFDAQSGYHHMELSAKARPKSAFVTPTDKYEFTRCPFGLMQAPAYFQRLINKVLVGLDFAFGYLDDILIHSPDVPTHLIHMRQLFQRLREADLKLNREKCNFFKSHIQYLGHSISGEGIELLPEKLESIKGMPSPTTPKEVKQFLGLIGYYRKFVPRFVDIARPLTNLT